VRGQAGRDYNQLLGELVIFEPEFRLLKHAQFGTFPLTELPDDDVAYTFRFNPNDDDEEPSGVGLCGKHFYRTDIEEHTRRCRRSLKCSVRRSQKCRNESGVSCDRRLGQAVRSAAARLARRICRTILQGVMVKSPPPIVNARHKGAKLQPKPNPTANQCRYLTVL